MNWDFEFGRRHDNPADLARPWANVLWQTQYDKAMTPNLFGAIVDATIGRIEAHADKKQLLDQQYWLKVGRLLVIDPDTSQLIEELLSVQCRGVARTYGVVDNTARLIDGMVAENVPSILLTEVVMALPQTKSLGQSLAFAPVMAIESMEKI